MFKNDFLNKFFIYIPIKLVPALVTMFFIFVLYKLLPNGQYVHYSICVTVSLISAQVFGAWLGSGFIYFYSDKNNKYIFFKDSLIVLSYVAPLASVVAGFVACYFLGGLNIFLIVAGLCLAQILFFFLASVCQAAFFVRFQLAAIILQGVVQLGAVFAIFSWISVTFEAAVIALILGYVASSILLLIYCTKEFRFESRKDVDEGSRATGSSLFKYAGALMPWMLGMLVSNAADRFAIAHYQILGGDAYISVRDLIVGASGLISMPLLMLVHPIIVKTFKQGRFAIELVESSLGFLILAFTVLWFALVNIGFDFIRHVTTKNIDVPDLILFLGFAATCLNCAVIYVQKRMEVHKKLRGLAIWSLVSAGIALLSVTIGGKYFGLLGIALGSLLAQVVYFLLACKSIASVADFRSAVTRPFLVAVLTGLFGSALLYALDYGFPGLGWWWRFCIWTGSYCAFCIIAFWRGVHWHILMASMGGKKPA